MHDFFRADPYGEESRSHITDNVYGRDRKYRYMKVCYLPGQPSTYPRTAVFIRGMRKNKVAFIDCSYYKQVWYRYIMSLIKFLESKEKADVILVGFYGQILTFIVKFLTRKKIIFDAFLSTYDTLCYDRKRIKPNSFLGKLSFWIDKYSCKIADFILLDTNEHINYFHDTFGVPLHKMARVFVGADTSIFSPLTQEVSDRNKTFFVLFYGSFLPLHGVPYILQTAKILLVSREEVNFNIIGKGQTFKECLRYARTHRLTNVIFHDRKPLCELPFWITESDVVLGIFGNTEKAKRVIPTKVYHALAMKKPVITSNTPAILELLEHRKSAMLCDSQNPHSLVNAILELKNNPELTNRIAENGYKVFSDRCTEEIIGKQLVEVIENIEK